MAFRSDVARGESLDRATAARGGSLGIVRKFAPQRARYGDGYGSSS